MGHVATILIEGDYIEVDGIKFPFISMEPALNTNMLFKYLNMYLLTRYFECCRLLSDRCIKKNLSFTTFIKLSLSSLKFELLDNDILQLGCVRCVYNCQPHVNVS